MTDGSAGSTATLNDWLLAVLAFKPPNEIPSPVVDE
jgi:hypothetical protein